MRLVGWLHHVHVVVGGRLGMGICMEFMSMPGMSGMGVVWAWEDGRSEQHE